MSLTDCKSESPQEALENFIEATRNKAFSEVGMAYESPDLIEENYKTAKAELVKWMSYIP